jgi:hypothetical protein
MKEVTHGEHKTEVVCYGDTETFKNQICRMSGHSWEEKHKDKAN